MSSFIRSENKQKQSRAKSMSIYNVLGIKILQLKCSKLFVLFIPPYGRLAIISFRLSVLQNGEGQRIVNRAYSSYRWQLIRHSIIK